MNTAEIVIFVIAGIFASLFIILTVYGTRKNLKQRKQEKNYQNYVGSVQIGDTFGHNNFKFSDLNDPFSENYNNFKFSDLNDPFSENYNTSGFDPGYYVTILDIKKNYKGETWVKYCFTQYLNIKGYSTFTDEINEFLRYRTRISERIDNINTNE